MDIKYWIGFLSEWLGVIAIVMIAGTSPLLTKIRQIDFRFSRREAVFSLSIFAVCYLLAMQFFSNPFFEFAKNFANRFVGGETAERMLLAVFCLILFLLALILRGQPLKSIGWGKANLKAGSITGLLILVLVVFLRGKFPALIGGITPEQGNLLIVWMVLALAEETIFRGYIQLRLSSFLGPTWGWLATAALYFLWLLVGKLWVLPFTELWPILIVSLVQALLLGWIMRKTGHVLAPALYHLAAGWLLLI